MIKILLLYLNTAFIFQFTIGFPTLRSILYLPVFCLLSICRFVLIKKSLCLDSEFSPVTVYSYLPAYPIIVLLLIHVKSLSSEFII